MEEEVTLTEEQAEELRKYNVIQYIKDLLIYDYLLDNGSHVELSEERIAEIDEFRTTRSIEFYSELEEDGEEKENKLHARFVYNGENKEVEKEE